MYCHLVAYLFSVLEEYVGMLITYMTIATCVNYIQYYYVVCFIKCAKHIDNGKVWCTSSIKKCGTTVTALPMMLTSAATVHKLHMYLVHSKYCECSIVSTFTRCQITIFCNHKHSGSF